jgi:hypothetical protein
MRSVTRDVCLQIVNSGPPVPSGSGAISRGLASLGGFGGAFHFARGDDERLCMMPPTKPSLEGIFPAPMVAASLHLCTMRDTNSSLFGIVVAPLVVASGFLLRTMPFAKSSLLDNIHASPVTTNGFLRTMSHANSSPYYTVSATLVAASVSAFRRTMPIAKSSLSGNIDAPLMAAGGSLRTVPFAKSSLLVIIGASLVAASLHLRTVSHTNSSLQYTVDATLVTASLRTMPPTNTPHECIGGAPLVAASLHPCTMIFTIYSSLFDNIIHAPLVAALLLHDGHQCLLLGLPAMICIEDDERERWCSRWMNTRCLCCHAGWQIMATKGRMKRKACHFRHDVIKSYYS